ncbi:WhiB family transcriptional regulator (plasmid) [Streptomyces sp. AHU1]|uniref:WhiB family transcriptional regulator n=1 Tax=Streptomyces sp. AHU1 TaxID=3377215 RepID=UPI003877EC0F
MSHPIINKAKKAAIDARFPFPSTTQPTPCQVRPQDFDFKNGDRSAGGGEVEQRLAKTRAACNGCPVAAGCLLWALVHEQETRERIYATTTPRQRTGLRKRLKERLGPDWRDVLAAQNEVRRKKAAVARNTPLTVNQARIVDLDRQVNGPMPRPGTLTAACQEGNRNRLVASLRLTRPRKNPAKAS